MWTWCIVHIVVCVFSYIVVSAWWWPTQKRAETCSWFLQQFENTVVLPRPYTHWNSIRISLNSLASDTNSNPCSISQVFTYGQTEINMRNFATVYYEMAKEKNFLNWWSIHNILIFHSVFIFLYFSALTFSHIQRQTKPLKCKHIARGKAVINGYATKEIAYFLFSQRGLVYILIKNITENRKKRNKRRAMLVLYCVENFKVQTA
jgi:hypothetical protein